MHKLALFPVYHTLLFQTDTVSYSLERFACADPEKTEAKDATTWP